MKLSEIHKLVEEYIGTNGGYLNNFSYASHDAFYPRYCDLEIDTASYRARGLTTRNAFIQILKEAKPKDQAKIIRGVFKMLPPPIEGTMEAARKRVLHEELVSVAARIEVGGEVRLPKIAHTNEAVVEAIKDAQVLLKERGAKSAVDRVHTALHGYLKALCKERSLDLQDDAPITTAFKLIRERFDEFSLVIPHDIEAKRLLGSIASALDTLNTIRNRGTLAHPNQMLLQAPEAMLYINLAQAVLAYLEAKLHAEDAGTSFADGAFGRKNGPIAEPILAELSSASVELLIAASKDEKGTVLCATDLQGVQVVTNNRQFVQGSSPRSAAAWQGAVEQLVNLGLIKDIGMGGCVFRVTDEGYRVADLL